MPERLLAPGLYSYDAVEIGDRIETAAVEITADAIAAFAALSGDNFEIHLSDLGAQYPGFPSQVAHGLLILSLVDGLKNQCLARFDALASLGWDWTFRKPVFAGDRIRASLRVEAKRPTSNPLRGILTIGFAVSDQHGVLVQKGQNQLMAYRQR